MGIKKQSFVDLLQTLNTVCLDTSSLIYHIDGIQPYRQLTSLLFGAISDEQIKGCISTISVAEFLVKPFRENQPQQISNFEQFTLSLDIEEIDLTHQIAKQASRLRASYGGFKLPDAIIAATALYRGCDALITNDFDLNRVSAEGIVVIVLSDYVS